MEFELIFLLFIFSISMGWWWIAALMFLAFIVICRLDASASAAINEKKLKEQKEQEEKMRKKELIQEEKELMRKKYPDFPFDRSLRIQKIRILSRHERTGHITEPEKELLEVLKNSMQ